MMLNRLKTVSKSVLMPGGSLLLPMLVLALGIHAALLAMPIPSSEIPEAEDKKNPISVNQIPTEQPAKANTKPTKSVDVPAVAKAPIVSGSTGGDTATADSSATTASNSTTSGSSSSRSTSVSSANSAPTATKASTQLSSTAETTSTEATSSTANERSAETASSAYTSDQTSEASSVTTTTLAADGIVTNPFPDFPHYQPAAVDCYGLGFGENCRVIENQDIAQVVNFFKQKLASKDFTAQLVNDEPNRKVFKVTKGDVAVFLNIWKGKDKVSYLLSKEALNQSPEELKAGSSQ